MQYVISYCGTYNVRQGCYGDIACSATVKVVFNAVPSQRPSQVPTLSPSLTPTMSPTLSFVNVGTYYVGTGNSINQPTLTCQETCAQLFGGSASQYRGSTSSGYITRTCNLASYRSGCVVEVDTYKYCTIYSNGIGCKSAYVNDVCFMMNYCFSEIAMSLSIGDPSYSCQAFSATPQVSFTAIYLFSSIDEASILF